MARCTSLIAFEFKVYVLHSNLRYIVARCHNGDVMRGKKTWKHPPRARFWRRSKNGVFLCVRDVCSWTKISPKYLSLTRICLCTLTFKGDAITRARVVREITVAVCDSLKHPNDTTQLYTTYKKKLHRLCLEKPLNELAEHHTNSAKTRR